MIKLVASDIDGTLLPEGMKDLNPEIYDIILELKKNNISFIAASGRQLESQELLFAPIVDEISYISENGAICKLLGKQYVISEFDRALAMRIIEEVEKYPNCNLTVSTPSTQYIKAGNQEFHDYMSNHLRYQVTPIASFKDIHEPIVKMAFLDTVTTSASFEHFKSLFKNEIRVVTAGNLWVDFIPFTSNKGTALQFILDKLQLTADEAICFGDQQNDIEMLDLLTNSYAMAHSKSDVQKHATHITESVEKTLRELLKTLG